MTSAKKTMIALIVLIIVIIVGLVWYMSSNSNNSALNSMRNEPSSPGSQNQQPVVVHTAIIDTTAPSPASDSSDAGLQQDMNAVDNQMNNLNNDSSAAAPQLQ